MKSFSLTMTTLFCAFITGCATYTGHSPKLEKAPPKATNGVVLINGNTDPNEQIFFSDGITTLKGKFSEFTNYFIAHYAKESDEKLNGKTLEITVLSISCSGSYITNCYVSVSALTGAGKRAIFNTENVYGYGGLLTASKALEQLAERMRSDQDLNRYIYQ